jgi:hypothetical protein
MRRPRLINGDVVRDHQVDGSCREREPIPRGLNHRLIASPGDIPGVFLGQVGVASDPSRLNVDRAGFFSLAPQVDYDHGPIPPSVQSSSIHAAPTGSNPT